ncbi:uncharacterized protein LOC115988418 isoform X1 [Quercus lobata]|uniref:uncharacterized protein LOC115988418 isoform X1 n=1 Tax=Quercus lobata TaxID=97700 RepID=UPI001243D3B8|nr:uncharacterized protein LOC115988418 isoform X1 [Quercus lobata]
MMGEAYLWIVAFFPFIHKECGEQSILWTYTCKIAVFQIFGAVDFFVLTFMYIYRDGLSFNMDLVLSCMPNPGTSYILCLAPPLLSGSACQKYSEAIFRYTAKCQASPKNFSFRVIKVVGQYSVLMGLSVGNLIASAGF